MEKKKIIKSLFPFLRESESLKNPWFWGSSHFSLSVGRSGASWPQQEPDREGGAWDLGGQ